LRGLVLVMATAGLLAACGDKTGKGKTDGNNEGVTTSQTGFSDAVERAVGSKPVTALIVTEKGDFVPVDGNGKPFKRCDLTPPTGTTEATHEESKATKEPLRDKDGNIDPCGLFNAGSRVEINRVEPVSIIQFHINPHCWATSAGGRNYATCK
jgi:hypothetical protein